MQKSIIVNQYLKKGTKIKGNLISSMRPAKGISPLYIDKIIGKKLTRSKGKNEVLFWNDFK